MRRFLHRIPRKSFHRTLLDTPHAWCAGIMKLDDELLLTDWKSPSFEPYAGCDDMWEANDGYMRMFGKRGDQNRIFGQFAMKYREKGSYRWVPAIVDTGARGMYLCRKSLKELGVPLGTNTLAPNGYTIMVGKLQCAGVTMIEEQGVTASGHGLDGDINIIGMEILGSECVEAIRKVLEAKIGHPIPAVIPTCWVQLVDSPESATNTSTATAFKVSPTANDIDGLKKAVQAKRAKAGVVVDPLTMKVYACIAEGVWAEVLEPWTPLTANTGLTAYHVVVQKS